MIETTKIDMLHSPEAEQDVLGSILRDSRAFENICPVIGKSDYFFEPRHRVIYDAMLRLDRKGTPIDHTLVADELTKMKQLDVVGGRSYLIKLLDGTATTANAVYYAKIVADLHERRTLVYGFTNIASLGYDASITTDELKERGELILTDVSEFERVEIVSAGDLVQSYLADIFAEKKDGDQPYLETRIADLNRQIGGIYQGDLTIIGGPPSMGKTSFAMDTAILNCLYGRKTLYFALDERQDAVAQRLLTGATGTDNRRFYARDFSEREQDMMTQAAIDIANNDHLHIVKRRGSMTVYDIRSIARRFKRKNNLHCIIVDYIQQINSYEQYERRELEVAAQIRVLKAIAEELDIAVIGVSQLNRGYSELTINTEKAKYGFPTMAMLRESGAIEQEANLILFVWNILEAMRKRGTSKDDIDYRREASRVSVGSEPAFIVVAKNKLGETGEIECRWNPQRMMFYSEAYQPPDLTDDKQDEGELPF